MGTLWVSKQLPTACPALLQLLDTSAVGVRREKMYKLDDHVACAVAGITGEPLCSSSQCGTYSCIWGVQGQASQVGPSAAV